MADQNVFDESKKNQVPVNMIIDGKKTTIGQAHVTPGPDGIVHVEMDVKADGPEDITNLFSSGIGGYSLADAPVEGGPRHRESDADIQHRLGLEPHEHNSKQHRDMKPPWCNVCTLTADYKTPQKNFGFGTPANPLRG